MTSFTFYWPWLVILLPLPWLIRILLPASKGQTNPTILFPGLSRLQQAFRHSQKLKPQSWSWFQYLLWVLWACLVVAMMRPQLVNQYKSVINQGYDLMLAVDLSSSMRALDFSTKSKYISRLDVTKDVVSDFVEERQGDRIGLIVFGTHAYLQVPLTLDTTAIRHRLQNTVSGMAGPATAIGDAIGLAVNTLRNRPEGSRVLILLTDGDDTASTLPPLQAAKLAKQFGIRIYAIAVGKEGPVLFPDQHGNIIEAHIPIDENLLKEIAQITEGQFFRAMDAQELSEIYDHINTLEKTKAEVREYIIRKPLYPYPLAGAALILLLIACIPHLRRIKHVPA